MFVLPYIQNICKLQNLDNLLIIAYLTKNHILKLENFVKSGVYKSKVAKDAIFDDYYGIYKERAQEFQFS